MTCVTMRQVSRSGWEIVSNSGHVLQKDLHFANLYTAEEYIKTYVSSFQGWRYELKPLNPEVERVGNRVRR